MRLPRQELSKQARTCARAHARAALCTLAHIDGAGQSDFLIVVVVVSRAFSGVTSIRSDSRAAPVTGMSKEGILQGEHLDRAAPGVQVDCVRWDAREQRGTGSFFPPFFFFREQEQQQQQRQLTRRTR